MSSTKTVLLCGVGGQGTITAADLLARAAAEAGYDVKVSEIHGMAQRGGAVSTVVRFGEEVHSMVADKGAVDYIVAFEPLEALRNLDFLKTDGYLLVASEIIKPMPVALGSATMPAGMFEILDSAGAKVIDSSAMAAAAGNVKCENVVLLGALESKLGFGASLWHKVIEGRVPPKTLDSNLAAFQAGLQSASVN